MPVPREITEPKQLVVEGGDARVFFGVLLDHMSLCGVQVQDFGGKDELGGFLKALRIAPNFERVVTSVGIVRDAETNAAAAFQSVCGALSGAGLPVPAQPLMPMGYGPQINVLILPDAATPGMLKTVLLRAVAGDPVMECIDQYLRCVRRQTGSLPGNMPKAQVQAFLASRPRPGLPIGHAARAGYLSLDSPAYDDVKQFLQVL